MSNKKIITRAERQQKIAIQNDKLNNHINKGIESYVRNIYEDVKEARKNARWYEAGEALVEAKLRGQNDADKEFLEEFNDWASREQEALYAELNSNEAKLLEAEDDVIDVEYKQISLPPRKARISLLGASSNRNIPSIPSLPSLPSSNNSNSLDEENNKFGDI